MILSQFHPPHILITYCTKIHLTKQQTLVAEPKVSASLGLIRKQNAKYNINIIPSDTPTNINLHYYYYYYYYLLFSSLNCL
jgi:hypothetical protein